MKKLLLISSLMLGLGACSSNQVPNSKQLSYDVQTLPASTVISVLAEHDFKIPKNGQIVEQTGTFKTLDNTYDELGNKVLIPRDAIISGTYTNDGIHCSVAWKSIYANKDAFKEKHGSFAIAETSAPSICDPVLGVKTGNRLTVWFKNGVKD